MKTAKLKDKLIAALTAYDRRESTKRSYNPHALGQYFFAADDVCERIEKGESISAALEACFCDRLLTHCQRALSTEITAAKAEVTQ